mgnify:CR=1 FL=1
MSNRAKSPTFNFTNFMSKSPTFPAYFVVFLSKFSVFSPAPRRKIICNTKTKQNNNNNNNTMLPSALEAEGLRLLRRKGLPPEERAEQPPSKKKKKKKKKKSEEEKEVKNRYAPVSPDHYLAAADFMNRACSMGYFERALGGEGHAEALLRRCFALCATAAAKKEDFAAPATRVAKLFMTHHVADMVRRLGHTSPKIVRLMLHDSYEQHEAAEDDRHQLRRRRHRRAARRRPAAPPPACIGKAPCRPGGPGPQGRGS